MNMCNIMLSSSCSMCTLIQAPESLQFKNVRWALLHINVLKTPFFYLGQEVLFSSRQKHELPWFHFPESSLSVLSATRQTAPQGSTSSSSNIIPIIIPKKCYFIFQSNILTTVRMLDFFLVSPNSVSKAAVQHLSLDQLRSSKGRRQGAFICMQALSHRAGISLRHGESYGLHEAQG